MELLENITEKISYEIAFHFERTTQISASLFQMKHALLWAIMAHAFWHIICL
ncbi:Uncharacterised protein [Salmonella enterica subsp. indica]|uniref:Uncharacterized protein n=1 Tax=Salmonella enterica subsp. indica TaxID=59207 RepID=A0A379YME0_SALER|nr:Uncharacterised protein [Salmonella enterica subsp. indica]